MAQIDALKKLIREELRAVLREELPKLLKEVQAPAVKSAQKSLQEQVKAKIPGTLNTQASRPQIKFDTSNPMAAFLNDTAKSMLQEDFSMTSADVHPALAFQPNQVKVGSVEGMLGSAKPSSNINAVQINEVPDFSALMGKLKQQGQI